MASVRKVHNSPAPAMFQLMNPSVILCNCVGMGSSRHAYMHVRKCENVRKFVNEITQPPNRTFAPNVTLQSWESMDIPFRPVNIGPMMQVMWRSVSAQVALDHLHVLRIVSILILYAATAKRPRKPTKLVKISLNINVLNGTHCLASPGLQESLIWPLEVKATFRCAFYARAEGREKRPKGIP